MAVEVKTDSSQFEAGIPRLLFDAQIEDGGWRNQYVVSGDGQRFLVNTFAVDAVQGPITVVLNWTSGLKK